MNNVNYKYYLVGSKGILRIGYSKTIGTGAACDLIISDNTGLIKNQHCQIKTVKRLGFITNLSENAKTWVNGVPIDHKSQTVLRHNDSVKIGHLHYKFMVKISPIEIIDLAKPEARVKPFKKGENTLFTFEQINRARNIVINNARVTQVQKIQRVPQVQSTKLASQRVQSVILNPKVHSANLKVHSANLKVHSVNLKVQSKGRQDIFPEVEYCKKTKKIRPIVNIKIKGLTKQGKSFHSSSTERMKK